MPAGVEITKPNGVVLIDNNFANLSVVEQGTEPADPMPSLGTAQLMATNQSSISSTSYRWFKFGPPVSNAKFGLQLFDAAGNMLFCASLKTARVVGRINVGAIGSAPKTLTLPTGRAYAASVSLMIFMEVQLRGSGISQEYRIVRRQPYATVSGNVVTAGWMEDVFQDWTPVGQSGVASFPAPAYDPVVLALDVTNY